MKGSRLGILCDSRASTWVSVCLLGCALTVSGCLPIPYPPYAKNRISEETLQAIQPKQSTRSDVLLLLADPTVRGKEDAYFVYEWMQGHGGLIFLATAGYTAVPVADVGSGNCNRFAIKFAPDGHVERTRQFLGQAKVAGKTLLDKNAESIDSACSDPDLSAAIDAWVEMEPGHAPCKALQLALGKPDALPERGEVAGVDGAS